MAGNNVCHVKRENEKKRVVMKRKFFKTIYGTKREKTIGPKYKSPGELFGTPNVVAEIRRVRQSWLGNVK